MQIDFKDDNALNNWYVNSMLSLNIFSKMVQLQQYETTALNHSKR